MSEVGVHGVDRHGRHWWGTTDREPSRLNGAREVFHRVDREGHPTGWDKEQL